MVRRPRQREARRDRDPAVPSSETRRIHADVVVLDVGNSLGQGVQHICLAVDAVVLVTTPETAAVAGGFAAIKALMRSARPRRLAAVSDPPRLLYVAVNRALSKREVATVRYRLGRACRRLLGVELDDGRRTRLPQLSILDTATEKELNSERFSNRYNTRTMGAAECR